MQQLWNNVQNYVNGYAGLKYTDQGFVMQPCLPPHGVTALTLRNLALASSRFYVRYDAKFLVVTLTEGTPCTLEKRNSGQSVKMQLRKPITMGWVEGDIFEIVSYA